MKIKVTWNNKSKLVNIIEFAKLETLLQRLMQDYKVEVVNG